MINRKSSTSRSVAAMIGSAAIAFSLVACAGGGTATPTQTTDGPAGEPVQGGALTAAQISAPLNLDPALLMNASQGNGMLGNALYGTLMISDETTGEIEYSIATDFSSTDGGTTFTLTLRDDVTFSDGTPYDAAAVKYNWDRLKDETLASNSLPDATMIADTAVVDPQTLTVTLTRPAPYFGTQVIESSMNWVAQPDALALGQAEFDENPIGAGPFVLDSWTRGGTIELVKNDEYWDAPRPYLDALTINTTDNSQQRVNAVVTGDVDIASENDWLGVEKAEQASLQVQSEPMAGGQYLALNTAAAPFDNPLAREAVSKAIDIDSLNTALYGTAAVPAETLFPETSPLYNDVPLHTYDPEAAQEIFDELADAGTPVSFTFTVFRGSEALGEAVQAQLSLLENVTAEIDIADWSETGRILGQHEFEMTLAATNFVDPEPTLFNSFDSESRRNATGISDPQLDEALTQGRFAETLDERIEAYTLAAERLAATNPAIYYTRAAQVAIANTAVGGIDLYGRGSILPDRLWVQD
ncbi:ABC transporter substrate-binding protein [Microbacterium allomyrinae]|uniref:ABC transporter substrate-binding protein n=1 Tax=Microbacterium allomyrinae TaxID=2830666 RepID=A0A9X1LWS9_9MICO|nr:ABC transporter substrate-binding protein [Microbacterium allomyrinae]MCC2033256.1 ABC transporter substrate-binding protein [Microbacterium allomyrinae]